MLFFTGGNITRVRFFGITSRVSFIDIAVFPRFASHGFSRDLINSRRSAQQREINKRAPVSKRIGNYIVVASATIFFTTSAIIFGLPTSYSRVFVSTGKNGTIKFTINSAGWMLSNYFYDCDFIADSLFCIFKRASVVFETRCLRITFKKHLSDIFVTCRTALMLLHRIRLRDLLCVASASFLLWQFTLFAKQYVIINTIII